jgi:hypothetical protein
MRPRDKRGLLHAHPGSDVAQRQPGDAGLVRGVPGRVDDLPPDCLMTFGSPITIRFLLSPFDHEPALTPCQGGKY